MNKARDREGPANRRLTLRGCVYRSYDTSLIRRPQSAQGDALIAEAGAMRSAAERPIDHLTAAGLAADDVKQWAAAHPRITGVLAEDGHALSNFCRRCAGLLARLPAKPRRDLAEEAAAELIKQHARQARVRFMQAHAEALYDSLTGGRSRFLRVDELLRAAGSAVSGLVPQEIEDGIALRDKEGAEIDQGLFLAAILASQRCGNHLCHSMLLPCRRRSSCCRNLPSGN
jgi:hypothetical protein